MLDPHYLAQELYEQIGKDSRVFEFLQAGSLDGIWYWDLEHPNHEWMSPRFWQTFGHTPDSKQHLAQEWQDMIHPEDLQLAQENFRKHIADANHPYDQVVRYTHKDGSTVWVRCRGLAIRDERGRAIRMLGAHTDITAVKQAEAELKRLSDALQISNHRFRTMVEQSPDGIVVANTQGNIVLVNRQTEQLFGYLRDELLDQPVERLMPSRFHHRHVEHRASYMRSPSSRPMGLGLELCGQHKSGAEFPIAISLNQLQIDNELLVVSCIRDITAYQRAGQEIKALNEELSERNATLQRLNNELEAFAYSVSHDLRAPLRSIDGFSKILLEDHQHQLDAEGQRVLGVICDSATKMGRLIDDLLMFSRLSRRAVETQAVDMTHLAREAYEQALALEPPRQIQFKLDDLPIIQGDTAMLRQVWNNLLSNAVKYTRLSADAAITVTGRMEDSQAHYEVCDNGIGFDMKYAHKLFGVFERLHTADHFEGTGVGLALTQRIIDRHGGHIAAHGTPNQGSVFSFCLPL